MPDVMDGIELEQSPVFLRVDRRLETVGPWFLTAIVLIALLGGFGSSPWVRTTSRSPGEAALQFPPIVRSGERFELRVTANPTSDDTASFELDRAVFNNLDNLAIRPAPQVQMITATGIRYSFATSAGAGPLEVRIEARAHRMGSIEGVVRWTDRESVSWRQAVLP